MIARKDQYRVGSFLKDEVQVLVNGVSRAPVPVPSSSTQIGLAQVNAAALTVQVPGFANANVGVEGMGAVLGEDGHVIDTGIHTI